MHSIIKTAAEYELAKTQLREMFNSDACLVDMNEANDLMKAMDKYEAKCTLERCVQSRKEIQENTVNS